MGWKIVTVSDVTIKFYSISEELGNYRDILLQFISNISPAVLAMVMVITISTIVVLFVYSVYIAVRDFSSFDEPQQNKNAGDKRNG